MTAVAVEGTWAEGYEAVRDAFAANFADRGEIGAAVSVVVDGRLVVDLWAGVADAHTGRAWAEDTPVLVYSATKGPTAACALLLWERGLLDIDAPVAEVWPEFAAAGKGAVTTRHLLTHQAGLPVFDEPIAFSDCHDSDLVAARLASQTPHWEPATAHGYHPLTFGWLVGEVVRRVDGRSVGRMLADEVAGPLGLDLWLGLPPEREASVARLAPGRFDLSGMTPGDPGLIFAAGHHGRRVADLQRLRQPARPVRRRVVQRPGAAPGRVAGGQRHRHRPGAGSLLRRAGVRPDPLGGHPRRGVPPPGDRSRPGPGHRHNFGLGFSLHSVMTGPGGRSWERSAGRSRRLVEALYSCV